MGVPTHRSRQFRFAALGIILLTVAIRLPSLLHPQPIDSEEMYSVVANEIVDGGRPYIDAVERKPPLLFWTYAAVFKVAGRVQLEGAPHGFTVWTLCTMAGLYVIGHELFDRNTGLIAALFYSVFQPWWELEEPLVRRRDAYESPYHLGVGNRIPPQFVATATRTLSSRCASCARPSCSNSRPR